MSEPDDRGFSVQDRRRFTGDGETRAVDAADAAGGEGEKRAPAAAPPIDFTTFVVSLTGSAYYALGEVSDANSTGSGQSLEMARQSIDLLGLLKEKTRGNLSPEEEAVLDAALYDLRIRFVEASRARGAPAP